MGEVNVRPITSTEDRNQFYMAMLDDIDAIEHMIREDLFVKGDIHIGAEQELCLINQSADPSIRALEILKKIDHPQYTHELGRFNLEINLNPYRLTGTCFRQVKEELVHLLRIGDKRAREFDDRLIMAGILPTLKRKHLNFDNMTPKPRYKSLSEVLLKFRGNDFQIYLQGVDDLYSHLDSVLFEACNTSFQLHLQVNPDEFVDKYNWAQLIAGPVLAAGASSPILFGRELWAETRIALFKQSLDTRTFSSHIRTKQPRVRFGSDWIHESYAEIFKDQITRFPLILTSTRPLRSSMEMLKEGTIPKLMALSIHNGTTYCWNRPCYGFSGKKPHMRIECRYLPSGPSVVDEIANFVFWIGLMSSMPEDCANIWERMDFRIAKDNFIKAARYGLDAALFWFGTQYCSNVLIPDILVPLAKKGLITAGVNEDDIDYFLGVIQRRCQVHKNGATWMVDNYRKLTEKYSRNRALRFLTEEMSNNQQEPDLPVHEWPQISLSHYHKAMVQEEKVEDYMETDLVTMNEQDAIGLALKIIQWRNINHILIENDEHEVIGVVSTTDLKQYMIDSPESQLPVRDIMSDKVFYVEVDAPISNAEFIMQDHAIHCLPVIDNGILSGIITSSDIASKKWLNEGAPDRET
jgi:CBS domain-containing protein